MRLALAAILFALGVALGRALEDNPPPGVTVTRTGSLTFTVETR